MSGGRGGKRAAPTARDPPEDLAGSPGRKKRGKAKSKLQPTMPQRRLLIWQTLLKRLYKVRQQDSWSTDSTSQKSQSNRFRREKRRIAGDGVEDSGIVGCG